MLSILPPHPPTPPTPSPHPLYLTASYIISLLLFVCVFEYTRSTVWIKVTNRWINFPRCQMKVSVKLRINCKLSNLCVLTIARWYLRTYDIPLWLLTLIGSVSEGAITTDRKLNILTSKDNTSAIAYDQKSLLNVLKVESEGTTWHAGNILTPCLSLLISCTECKWIQVNR